jgi:hypothetical protein
MEEDIKLIVKYLDRIAVAVRESGRGYMEDSLEMYCKGML